MVFTTILSLSLLCLGVVRRIVFLIILARNQYSRNYIGNIVVVGVNTCKFGF